MLRLNRDNFSHQQARFRRRPTHSTKKISSILDTGRRPQLLLKSREISLKDCKRVSNHTPLANSFRMVAMNVRKLSTPWRHA
jgi:hypothetical protein